MDWHLLTSVFIVVSVNYMLGVTRELKNKHGIRYCQLGQKGYIEERWRKYGDLRKGKPVPSTPFPQQADNLPPALNENDKPVGVTDQEAREVHEGSYRNLIGELLWPARNAYPSIPYGVGLLSKCVHRPSWGAWYAALYLLHFLYRYREDGIQYRSDGNIEPVCYYDSSFYQDKIGHRPHYGYVAYWAGRSTAFH